MITARNQFGHYAMEATVFVLVLGSLSMIWPSIMVLIFGLFLLLQPFGIEQQITMLIGAEINNVPIVLTSLRQSDLPAILS